MSCLAHLPPLRLGGTLADLLERRAAAHPEVPAIAARGREPLSYGELVEQVRGVAAALARLGRVREDRIAVVMPHGPELATACLSFAATATCVPLNPDYTELELRALLRSLRVSLLVATADQRVARAAASASRLPWLEITADPRSPAGAFGLDLASASASTPRPPTDADELLGATPCDVALVLHTSGSTALPKVVPLTHGNLLASAAHVARSLDLGPEDVCLSTLPLFHIGGLVDLLLAPLSVGGRVVIASGMGGAHFFDHLEHARPTWYQGVPTMLQDILHHARAPGRARPDHRLRFVRSVSAPLPPPVLHDFERELGVPVIEMYGMTETAGLITSNPLPPGERRAGSVGLPAGPEVTIVDSAGGRAATGQRGEVLVRGPTVTAGYEQVDNAAEDGFLNGWLRTGDEGYFDADGYLYLTGRIEEIINRGGEKIAPREVDEAALDHPDVRDAAAFALPHATLGEDVALAVVPVRGRTLDLEELAAFFGERLARFKVPRSVFLLEALPRTPGGKLQRAKLPQLCLQAPNPDAVSGPERLALPTTERGAELLACWREALGRPDVSVHDDFFERGGDSLRAVELAVSVGERLGLDLPVAAIYDHPTVASLDAELDAMGLAPVVATANGSPRASDVRLVGRNVVGGRPPLFWGLHGYDELVDLAERLGPDQPVYGMRLLHAMECRSPADTTALARRYQSEIERLHPDGPVLLGGYCAGGRIAFEIARALRETGRDVASLCLAEHFSAESYSGRVAFFFSAESGWHPFRTAAPAWAAQYTGPSRLFPSRAAHEDIMRDDGIIEALRRELDEASLAGTGGVGRSLGARSTAQAEVTRRPGANGAAAPPRVLVSRERRAVTVSLDNRTGAAWPAGSFVFARWARPGADRVLFDASARTAEAVPLGGRTIVSLDLRAPLAPGPWTLSCHVVPGGDWSTGQGTTLFRRLVLVLPGRAVWAYVRSHLPWVGGWTRSGGRAG